jgi:hypothetical protein
MMRTSPASLISTLIKWSGWVHGLSGRVVPNMSPCKQGRAFIGLFPGLILAPQRKRERLTGLTLIAIVAPNAFIDAILYLEICHVPMDRSLGQANEYM